MAASANPTQTATRAAQSRARRPVARAREGAESLAPSYRPMWSLADQSIAAVDKGIRILPGRLGRPGPQP
ncbi:MAG TPA: hypothetical protein VNH20_00215 [Candidatus Dormibacteraeota bacterium]|nr:hypothetical protein [Candidatus Dormibacteraeota bacterium]